MILSQGYGIQETNNPREVGSAECTDRPFMSISMDAKTVNVMEKSQDNESIEGISGPEELEDEVFLGYFATEDNSNKEADTSASTIGSNASCQ